MINQQVRSGPQSFVGWGSSKHLSAAISNQAPQKILIITDPVLVSLPVFQDLLSIIEETNISFQLYSEITPEPSLQTADKLVAFARAGDFSMVIGIGGGSALDLAKLAAVFVTNQGDLQDYLNISGNRKVDKKGLYMIMIPTTSGTGSEVTDIAVLSLGHTKDVITHPFLQTDLAIVDPMLTVSVPAHVTAATGADALTHAIEAYLSVNSTVYSDTLALEAIRLMASALPKAVKDGQDKEARIAMSHGCYLAALSFFTAGVGAVHALAYPLGGEFKIPHGDSNAVMLPYVLNFIQGHCTNKLHNILRAMDGLAALSFETEKDIEMAAECVLRLRNLMMEIGIPNDLQGFRVPETSIPLLASQGIKQQRLLARCPVQLSEEDIYQIYNQAYHG